MSSAARGSACKRLNLFLRWMVRSDDVDPGGWENVPASKLIVTTSPSFLAMGAGSCTYRPNPVAHPVRDCNHYNCDHKVFSDDLPRWLSLCFGDNVTQNGEDGQSPYQTHDDGSGES